MEQKDIAQILFKHFRQESSLEEEAVLNQWLAREENRLFFDHITNKEVFHEKLKEITQLEINEGQGWEHIVKMGLPGTKQKYPRWKIRVWQYAAAAMAIGLIVTFLVWKQHNLPHKEPLPIAVQQPDALAPGGNRAILTLASGEKIQLDDAAIGQLARQGTTNVIKLDSGKLAYKEAGHTSTVSYNLLTTPKGGQYQITLPDGSRIWLNSASSLRFPVAFTETVRRVEVTGEAYFEVMPDRIRPFVVIVGQTEIEVLGTTFNINAYLDESDMRATLLTGKIRLIAHRQDMQIKVSPGEQAVVPNSGDRKVELSNNVNTEQVVAWKNGLFAFDDQDIPAIMRQLARWYDLEVVYEAPAPKIAFSGRMFRSMNATNVLKVLESMGLKFRVEGKKIIVMQ